MELSNKSGWNEHPRNSAIRDLICILLKEQLVDGARWSMAQRVASECNLGGLRKIKTEAPKVDCPLCDEYLISVRGHGFEMVVKINWAVSA